MEPTGAVASEVRVRQENGVAWIAIDHPPVNVLTMALLGKLERSLATLEADPTLRLIVLEGAGRSFSAGVDIGEHMGDSIGPMLDAFTKVAVRLIEGEVPVMAVVQGAALGGACELVALCDLAIVADDARIGVPEITLAVVPPVAAALFPAIVGRQRAAALVLSGESISGQEAATWGLVWRSVPADQLRAEAERAWGGEFALKRYHDQVISFGSPPVQFVRALVLELDVPSTETKREPKQKKVERK